MSGLIEGSKRGLCLAGLLAMAVVLGLGGQARAASYPGGGSSFSGSAEGWSLAQPPTCNIGLGGLCTASAGYDGANGNPAGSLAVTTAVAVNLGGLFKSTGVFESPNFTATEGGPATLSLDWQLASGSLLDLTPRLDYTAILIDRTAGDSTDVIAEAVTGSAEAFASKEAATKLVAGHTYAILIDSETSSSVANVGLLGSASARFDNVAVTVGNSGNSGGTGGPGAGGGARRQRSHQLDPDLPDPAPA